MFKLYGVYIAFVRKYGDNTLCPIDREPVKNDRVYTPFNNFDCTELH